ncbi:TetR/AcrR family transcriptional regulator [Streptomyces profundus]|uniref:TetR/AcrR family transcriptional regulator n=1 Tax=Streptomyces profundus TaxID=2867410 RepID=UPI001D167625|nr:TetR/AcrR family transcriptional regulator [Streptomyces sp. MA3_2.13]
MHEPSGLRERKKEATRQRLMRAAFDLFEEHGFDDVSCGRIAAAAEVSKKTLFNYFSLKADLILDAERHHVHDLADVVRAREPGQTPHGALHAQLLAALAQRLPATGLSDRPEALRLRRLIRANPMLAERERQFQDQRQRLLAEALIEENSPELTARLIATQVHGIRQVLFAENTRRVLAGEAADDVYPDAVAAAECAFRLLAEGLGDRLRRG